MTALRIIASSQIDRSALCRSTAATVLQRRSSLFAIASIAGRSKDNGLRPKTRASEDSSRPNQPLFPDYFPLAFEARHHQNPFQRCSRKSKGGSRLLNECFTHLL